ncbi:MAG: BrnT family toxin [Desulfovibrio sp.]|nr:BrnT family toxin [Desulfovibrio sp.]
MIVFTERDAIRIISARKATKREKKVYAEANR